jgi:hypothetical protein
MFVFKPRGVDWSSSQEIIERWNKYAPSDSQIDVKSLSQHFLRLLFNGDTRSLQ